MYTKVKNCFKYSVLLLIVFIIFLSLNLFVINPIKSIEAGRNIIYMIAEKDLLMVLIDYINIFMIQNNK
ncbi:hypothetical protein CPIN17260_0616 [Campylobacter pinnipediorum subsp. pinnipediorum]|nr:hypothetical protein CPIN17260_0616 [Campylobacter pinnipediorum subsp. pinnipediorum]AQW84232.1 hypothetical protein CPIN17262_0535 [Campylobacter pinnipediorum subsp. pinnipediorum]